jgi:transposase
MRYKSDVTDLQWEALKDYFSLGKYGNRRIHPVREMVNAVFYVVKSGCQWHMLPKDFPPFSAVFAFYNRCRTKGIWEKINADLVKKADCRANAFLRLREEDAVRRGNLAINGRFFLD